MTPLASVVVPTYKRPDLLDRCLEALLAQDAGDLPFEIIVADDAALEETGRQVLRWSERSRRGHGPAVRYVMVQGAHGPAAARNRGWRASEGEVIAFTDDDCVPGPLWLRSGARALSEGAEAAWGRVVMPLPPEPSDYELDASGLAFAEFVTANCFCRRDALEAAGGFDENFTVPWREDSDLHFTLLEQGRRVVHVPEAVVVHPVRPAPWGVSVAQQRKSRFEAMLFKKHPALYRRKIQPAAPLHYYAILAALHAAAGFGLAGKGALALGAAGTWVLLTAAFCGRRLRGTSRALRHVAEMAVTSALIPPLSVYWRLRGAVENRVLFL